MACGGCRGKLNIAVWKAPLEEQENRSLDTDITETPRYSHRIGKVCLYCGQIIGFRAKQVSGEWKQVPFCAHCVLEGVA